MSADGSRILADVRRLRDKLSALRPKYKRLTASIAPKKEAAPATGTRQPDRGARRKLASSMLNLLYARPDTEDTEEVPEMIPGTDITLYGVKRLVAVLTKRAGPPGATKKKAARRLLDYLMEPRKGGRPDGRVNPEHLVRLAVFFARLSRYGWERAKHEVVVLGGKDFQETLNKRQSARGPTAKQKAAQERKAQEQAAQEQAAQERAAKAQAAKSQALEPSPKT